MAKTGGTTKRKPKRSPGNRKLHNLALMRELNTFVIVRIHGCNYNSRTEELKHAIEYCQTNKCRGYAAMNANNYKYICDPKAINKYLDRKRFFENRFQNRTYSHDIYRSYIHIIHIHIYST